MDISFELHTSAVGKKTELRLAGLDPEKWVLNRQGLSAVRDKLKKEKTNRKRGKMFLKNCERSLRRSSFVRNEKQPLTAGYFRKVLLSSGAELTACNKVIIAEQTRRHCRRQCRCPPSHMPFPRVLRICPSVRVLRRSARTLREIVSAYRERNLLYTFLHQKKAGNLLFVVRKILAY